ncbi:MAG: SGNH/GDSL hydrolase family protein [Armatimonadetes bacterium]|nr:SGNH/GDSL hydrolase family protein [Armatimonadota bacterium]
MALCAVQIGLGILRPDLDSSALYLSVQDASGTYTIPYIQTADSLHVTPAFDSPDIVRVRLSLSAGGKPVASKLATRKQPQVSFRRLRPGEYVLRAQGLSRGGEELCRSEVTRIGIGTVIVAIGDSITEGYYGHGFSRGSALAAKDFPPEAVSRDGRNFPQFSPTTAWHLPEVNCFQSWMTDLNDLLTDSWQHPVFIANEGWGGYTTEAYLNLMRTDANWQARMGLLQPNVWLINLGVNDERAHVPPEAFAGNLRAIVQTVTEEYAAQPNRILIARPSYDYFEGAEPTLRSYCEQIDALVGELGLARGPDFFAAYAADQQRWYGADPVHPNVEGVRRMAELWHEALVRVIAEG